MAKKKKASKAKSGSSSPAKAKTSAPRTEAKKAAAPQSGRDRAAASLLGMVADLGSRFEELKRRTGEGAERAKEIAQEIRKNVIEPRWRALKNARAKKR